MNSMILRARQEGCGGCAFFAPFPSSKDYPDMGECRIAAPRTSGGVRWPHVSRTDFCALWETISVEERTGSLSIGQKL